MKHTKPPLPDCPICADARRVPIEECAEEMGRRRAATIYRVRENDLERHLNICVLWLEWQAAQNVRPIRPQKAAPAPAEGPEAQLERVQALVMTALESASDGRELATLAREARAGIELALRIRAGAPEEGLDGMPLERRVDLYEAAAVELRRRIAASGKGDK